jgi:hypothetical protein
LPPGGRDYLLRLSGNSEAVESPLNLSVLEFAAMVVSQQELVTKDRGQQLGAVVVKTAVPDLVAELEQVLEPLIEGLSAV